MAVDLWETGVSISVIYPGVVDTELFTLPDNDAFTGDVEAISVDDAVRTILEGIESGSHAVYVPAYFAEFAQTKARDVDGFLAGMAAYVQSSNPGPRPTEPKPPGHRTPSAVARSTSVRGHSTPSSTEEAAFRPSPPRSRRCRCR